MISDPATKKRFALFMDGTWNTVGDNTNVWRLKSLCSATSSDGTTQITYYDKGVNGFWGGTFGKGLSENIADAYKWLIDEYRPGDEVFIFGFSRGAYTARSLTGFITKCGLLKRGAPLGVNQLYQRYRRRDARTIWELMEQSKNGTLGQTSVEERWILKYSQAINIKLVGVWDTVGSLGVPALHVRGISRSTLAFHHTGLRRPIENAFHALAIDEHRRAFLPTLWTIRKSNDPTAAIAPPRSLSSVEQRWFVGAHANVGGGYPSDFLAQLPLHWMMKKASIHGLAFGNDFELDPDVLAASISDSYREFMHGAYAKFSCRSYRVIGDTPKKKADGIHSNVNETIDSSVFVRWRELLDYRPSNLLNWAKHYDVDITTLGKSVRADDPRTVVPD